MHGRHVSYDIGGVEKGGARGSWGKGKGKGQGKARQEGSKVQNNGR